jgi:hypothetical protein
MKLLFPLSAFSMALGVGCGAFGAHGLRDVVPPSDLLIWEKAVLYQLVHSLGALIALLASPTRLTAPRANAVAQLFLGGILVFSGSLYALVLLNQRWLGMITPLGGTAFIVGWVLFALSSRRSAA